MKFELGPESSGRFGFLPDGLRYFDSHFVCKAMEPWWEVPPAKPAGVSYKAADFVSWMLRAPIISEITKLALGVICEGLVEFLPFHSIKGKPYFATNVLNCDHDAPTYKSDQKSLPLVDGRFGAIIRDYALSGVALADPRNSIAGRVVRGESLHDFPGLVG